MVKRFVCAAMTVMMAATLFTGCVKVVKIGEEGALTGQVEFNPGDSVEEIWDSAVLPEFEEKAVDINEVLEKANGDLTSLGEEAGGVKTKSATSYNYCVKLEGATVASVDASASPPSVADGSMASAVPCASGCAVGSGVGVGEGWVWS